LLRAGTEPCIHAALAHMSMLSDVEHRGLGQPFPWPDSLPRAIAAPARGPRRPARPPASAPPPAPPRVDEILDIPFQDVPF
jgi:hypothetical protein